MKQSIRLFLTLIVCLIVSLSGVMVGKAYASGMGWVELRPAGDVNRRWYALATDATGIHLIAAAYGFSGTEGWVYTSADSGANWTKSEAFQASMYWQCAASDSDGSNLIAAVYDGRVYTSSNGGTDWTERRPAGNTSQRWLTVASDADGSHLIAGTSAGRLWTSSNGGSTWT